MRHRRDAFVIKRNGTRIARVVPMLRRSPPRRRAKRSPRGWKAPMRTPALRTTVTRHLRFHALAEGAVTESKAAELLGVPVRDLNRGMESRPGSPAPGNP